MVKQSAQNLRIISAALLLLAASIAAFGQSQVKKNNPYAPSPAGNLRKISPQSPETGQISTIASVKNDRSAIESRTHVIKYNVPDTSSRVAEPVAPTDIYRVGINDVLQIKLGNAAARPAYYTVSADGTIDFPLAGGDVEVKGLTVNEVVKKLKSSIKLFTDPRVEVSVSAYASHAVRVSGRVKNPGEKYLRREAVPLFVIKAEAIVDTDSNGVKVTSGSETQTYRLNDAQTDNLLIHPGTTLEFGVYDFRPPARYFVAGSDLKTSERPMAAGLTLLQAAATEAADARKATIHRKDKNGKFSRRDFDLKAIRAGKTANPTIESGDIIQIRD